MNHEVEGETGFRVCGIGYFFADLKSMDEHASWLEYARLYQLDSGMLSAAEAADLIPGGTKSWSGAMLTPSDGRAEPQKAAPAIAEGARVVTNCAVGGVDSSGGRVAEVVPDMFRFVREFMPAARLKAQNLRWRVTARSWQELRTRRRWSLDPEPFRPILDEAQKNIAEALPVFAKARITERWAGMIGVTPDVVPVISPAEALPGFFIATGFSGHGFGVGPGAGRLLADLVTGDGPVIDPTPFRFSRFSDGTRPEPYPLAL